MKSLNIVDISDDVFMHVKKVNYVEHPTNLLICEKLLPSFANLQNIELIKHSITTVPIICDTFRARFRDSAY